MKTNKKFIFSLLMLVITLFKLFSAEINEVIYQTGQKNGQYTFEENNLKYVVHYSNDTLHGNYKIYKAGDLEKKGRVYKGYKDGKQYMYTSSGKIVITYYNMGKINKIYIKNDVGKVYCKSFYDKEGRLDKEILYYLKNGKTKIDTSTKITGGTVFKKCFLDSYKDLRTSCYE